MDETRKEAQFVDGMMFSKPHDNAPDFIKGQISIKVDDMIASLQKYKKADGWVNIDMKKSKGGKLYFEYNTWEKPADASNPVVAPQVATTPTAPVGTSINSTPEYPAENIDPNDIPF